MKFFLNFLFFIIISTLSIASKIDKSQYVDRVVTIGGSVTEIVFKLGLEDLVVAVDQSSTIPEKVKELPQVGYIRAISSEGVLSTAPTKILTTTDIGPPNAVRQIKDSGVDIQIFNSPKNLEDIVALTIKISNIFNADKEAANIIKNIYKARDSISKLISKYKKKPKIAFFMNPSSGSYNAAGSGTNANYLIELIGAENIFSKDFKRYQKVDKEQILKYNPDAILVAGHYPGQKPSSHFKETPIFSSLKSVKKQNIISISMTDLTMGPAFVSNALSIMKKLNIETK